MKKSAVYAPTMFALVAFVSSFVTQNALAVFLEPGMSTERLFDIPVALGEYGGTDDGQTGWIAQSGSPISIERGMRGRIYEEQEMAPPYLGFDNMGFHFDKTYDVPGKMMHPSQGCVFRNEPEYFDGGDMQFPRRGTPVMLERSIRGPILGDREPWNSFRFREQERGDAYIKRNAAEKNRGCIHDENAMGRYKYDDAGKNRRFGSKSGEDRFDGDERAFHKNYRHERGGKRFATETESQGNAAHMGLLLVIGALIGLIIGLVIGQKEAFWVSKKKTSSEKK